MHICSLPAGSSGGPDSLRPQHLLDLTNCKETGPELISAITVLVNLLLARICLNEVRSTLFGGTLFAMRKESGGLRPIVIGYYWHRLSSKCANTFALPRVSSNFAVHTARRFLSKMVEGSILVKWISQMLLKAYAEVVCFLQFQTHYLNSCHIAI